MLKGKNAIITVARRGIGRACVELFAEYGANVWACARRHDDNFEADMSELSQNHGVWIEPVYFDLTDKEAMKDAVRAIRAKKDPIDVLVNNAGIMNRSRCFELMSEEDMAIVLDNNFFSRMRFTQYVARLMCKSIKKCSIVNISSYTAIDGEMCHVEYIASKSAVNAATKALAIGLAQNGIRVNAVAPGLIETDMGGGEQSSSRSDHLQNITQKDR